MKNTQHKAGFFTHLSQNSSNSSNSVQWCGLWITIRNMFWILRSQTRDCSRQMKKGKKPKGNQSYICPNPEVNSEINKRLQHSDYQIVIFKTAWTQWDKLLEVEFHICLDKCQAIYKTLSNFCPLTSLSVQILISYLVGVFTAVTVSGLHNSGALVSSESEWHSLFQNCLLVRYFMSKKWNYLWKEM